jgi:hypothetical protein
MFIVEPDRGAKATVAVGESGGESPLLVLGEEKDKILPTFPASSAMVLESC